MNEEEKLSQAIESASEEEAHLLTLANGAVIRAKALPDLMVQKLMRQFPRPKPPMVEVTSGGKTWVEANPSDPSYVEALKQRELEVGDAFLDLTMLVGFEIVKLPKGVRPIEEDDSWEEELEAVGIVVPEKRIPKKLLWIRYRVLQQASDLNKLRSTVERLGGVEEEAVETAEEQFRRQAG